MVWLSVGTPGASARRVVPGVGGVEALDDGLLAPKSHLLLGVSGGGPPRDPDLLGGAQALLDHDHLLVEGDDGRVALLAHRDGRLDPAVERDALDLDPLDRERRVDDLDLLADLGPDADRAGHLLALADDRPLLDHRHGHPLFRGRLRHLAPLPLPGPNALRRGMFRCAAAEHRPGPRNWETGDRPQAAVLSLPRPPPASPAASRVTASR